MTKCDEIVFVMDNLSTKKTNTIATDATTTAWRNCHIKKLKACYILHAVLLGIILLLIITIIGYHLQSKKVFYKVENNKF